MGMEGNRRVRGSERAERGGRDRGGVAGVSDDFFQKPIGLGEKETQMAGSDIARFVVGRDFG
jgi:hypothetical protein